MAPHPPFLMFQEVLTKGYLLTHDDHDHDQINHLPD